MRQRDSYTEAASCTGKVRHETQGAAVRHAAWTQHGFPYHCAFCHGWHIGNRPHKRPRPRRNPKPQTEDEGGTDA